SKRTRLSARPRLWLKHISRSKQRRGPRSPTVFGGALVGVRGRGRKDTPGATFPYGFGWGLSARSEMKQYSHGGAWAGYRTLNARFPEKRFAVVVLTNGPRADLEAVVNKAIEIYLR